MPQFLRPDSNVTQTSWTNGFAEIDEATASDTDFSYGSNNSSTARLEVSLSNPTSTPGAGTCTVRWRYAKVSSGTLSGTGGTVTQTCGVYEGTSLLSSSTVTTSGSWTAGSFTFNTSLVSDWTNLRLRFTQSGSGGGANARGSAVSWAEIEAPDAAYSLVAEKGNFTETGVAATLLHKAVLVASYGSFSEVGKDAGITRKAILTASGGAFNSTGIDAVILHTAILAASTGTFTFVGNAGTIYYVGGSDLNADPGQLTVSGSDAVIRRNAVLTLTTVQYIVTGGSASFSKSAVLLASPRAFNVTGRPASLRYSGTSSETRPFYYQIHDVESGIGTSQINSGKLVYHLNNFLQIL